MSYSYLVDEAEFTFVGVQSVARNLAQVGALSWAEADASSNDCAPSAAWSPAQRR